MFSPTGPSANATDSETSISLSGTSIANPVILITSNGNTPVEVVVSGTSGVLVDFFVYGITDHYFKLPFGTTSVSIYPSGSSTASSSIVLGEEI